MFKLMVFSALVAVAAAGLLAHKEVRSVYSTPILEKSVVHISEPVLTKIGEHVKTVPSAISHQSQTIVHSKPVVTPVLAHSVKAYSVPVLKTYAAPVVKAYSTPTVTAYAAPLRTYEGSIVKAYSTPVIKAYSAPLLSAHTAPLTFPATHVI